MSDEAQDRKADRAWAAWVLRIGGDPKTRCGLVRAPTRSKARYLAYLSCRDVYRDGKNLDIRVRRAPRFDALEFRDCVMARYL